MANEMNALSQYLECLRQEDTFSDDELQVVYVKSAKLHYLLKRKGKVALKHFLTTLDFELNLNALRRHRAVSLHLSHSHIVETRRNRPQCFHKLLGTRLDEPIPTGTRWVSA